MPKQTAVPLTVAAALVATTLLAGCYQNALTESELKSLDFGPEPQNAEQLVRDYLKPKIVDATSATISIKAGPKKLHQRYTMAVPQVWGWAVCAAVTDKNAFGVHAGRLVVMFIRDGKVIAAHNADGLDPIGSNYARSQCETLGYKAE